MKLNFYADELIMFKPMRRIVFIQTLTLIEKTFSYKYHMSYKDDGNNETHNISGFTGVLFELLL